MPELPEVENVRRTLASVLVGRVIEHVRVKRRDVIHGDSRGAALLHRGRISRVERHGKQLALVAARDGGTPCVCVHLGMSGSLRHVPAPARGPSARPLDHTHVSWRLDDGSMLRFRDPRRFGGLWTFENERLLRSQRWSALGADALTVRPGHLLRAFQSTSRNVKVALLDQRLVAGLGNIYVDELLFECRIHPLTPCRTLDSDRTRRLVRRMRRLLQQATAQGGSTLRDYVDGQGRPGRFQQIHRVYGRDGEPCSICHRLLVRSLVGGRGTVHCPSCQKRPILAL